MAKYYQLYVVVLTAVVISQSTCVGQILPGQIPRQIIPRQVITGQDQVQQQQDFFLIDESGTTVDGTGPGTGSILQLFPLALLTLAVTMMGMVTMSTVTSGTTVASTTTSVTVPTQTAAQTTPCVPTNCPAGYRLLTDQAVSPNCYFFSGNNEATWSTAQKICSTQRGAYLWRPNSEEEAEAVRISIGIEQNRDIWVGANSPGHDGNYVFDGDNGDLSFCSLPFGEHNSFTKKGCVEIEFTNEYVWNWDDDACKSTHRYVCEFPRITCP